MNDTSKVYANESGQSVIPAENVTESALVKAAIEPGFYYCLDDSVHEDLMEEPFLDAAGRPKHQWANPNAGRQVDKAVIQGLK